jgi:hypothetical protein
MVADRRTSHFPMVSIWRSGGSILILSWQSILF